MAVTLPLSVVATKRISGGPDHSERAGGHRPRGSAGHAKIAERAARQEKGREGEKHGNHDCMRVTT